MQNYSRNIIRLHYTIRQAFEALNTFELKSSLVLFVLNESEQLAGTLTDGDIRRGLLSGFTLDSGVEEIMFRNFRYIQLNSFYPAAIRALRKQDIELVPLLDGNKKIVRIIDLNHYHSLLPVDAIILAGGEGKRLAPLTTNIPKPLLKIGDKPILEHILDRLEKYGIDNIYISINYLKEKIISWVGNGMKKNLNIKFIMETKPLGTIGSVSLAGEFKNDYVLVMNSDLLTTIDLEDFFLDFLEKKADMAVATVPYKLKIPYATLEIEDHLVQSFKEKPSYTYYSNAGIYLAKKEILRFIPKNTRFDATDLMQKVVTEKLRLVSYPVLGYWLDIGKPEDYEKAQEDIKHIKL